jgi:hypothetical protein
MPVFVVGRVGGGPFAARGRRAGRGVHALVDAGDEIELPGPALDLPGAERDEAGEGEDGADRQRQPRGGGTLADRGCHQGMFFMSCIEAGIMLVFMWYMTHSEPASVMTTSTSVKISASMFQPPSDLASMCRK